jgi:hypothetical protein
MMGVPYQVLKGLLRRTHPILQRADQRVSAPVSAAAHPSARQRTRQRGNPRVFDDQ